MSKRSPSNPLPPTLTVRIGKVFEASATGWGILMVPVVLGALFTASIYLSAALE